MIESLFQTLGFKEEEARVYLALLDIGASSGGDIAKHMGMPRPTVYGYLDNLLQGGLVTRSMHRGVKIFVPEPAQKIQQLYARKIDALKQQQKELDEILPDLEKRLGMGFMRPNIQIFEGRSGMEAAMADHLSHQDIEMLAFWPIKAALQATSEDFFWYLNKERIKNNIYLKAIWPPEQAVDIKRNPFMGTGPEFKREIRVAPEGIDSSMGYWIYANKVLFASSRAESFCIIVESAELFEMMSNQHHVIWGLSEPVEPKHEDMKPFLDELYADD